MKRVLGARAASVGAMCAASFWKACHFYVAKIPTGIYFSKQTLKTRYERRSDRELRPLRRLLRDSQGRLVSFASVPSHSSIRLPGASSVIRAALLRPFFDPDRLGMLGRSQMAQ